MVAVLGIVFVLMMLLWGVFNRMPGVADRVKCTANLRGLGVGLSNYLEDRGHWPNQPPFGNTDQKQYEEWWIKELQPYEIPPAAWQCPAILRLGKIQQSGRSPRVHYSPTMFDSKPSTPRKWPNMPWLIEIASVHGHGPLLILPDGSVHDYDTFVALFKK